MKKLMNLILALTMISSTAFAECQWSTDIKKIDTGYLYTDSCHAKVGVTLKDNDDYKIEVKELRKTIEFKDLALKKADERTEEWMKATYKLEERVDKIESAANKTKWLYFILGVVATSAAVYGAGQLKP